MTLLRTSYTKLKTSNPPIFGPLYSKPEHTLKVGKTRCLFWCESV